LSGGVKECIVGSKLHISAKLSFDCLCIGMGRVAVTLPWSGNLIIFSGEGTLFLVKDFV